MTRVWLIGIWTSDHCAQINYDIACPIWILQNVSLGIAKDARELAYRTLKEKATFLKSFSEKEEMQKL
jgi:hypothetical protein